MRYLIIISIFALATIAAAAGIRTAAPESAKTTDDIRKAVAPFQGFNYIQTAQFTRWGREIFAVWYCPFSGRAACFLHAYYYDHRKERWIRFVDQLIDGSHDLSVEMPTKEMAVIFRGTDGKILLRESVEKFPVKMF